MSRSPGTRIRGSSIKKVFFRIGFPAFILTLTVVLPAIFFLLVLEKTTVVPEAKSVEVGSAARVSALAKKARKVISGTEANGALPLSEDDLNSVLGFLGRGVPGFKGKTEFAEDRIEIKAAFRLPQNPIGEYVNVSVVLRPSGEGLGIVRWSIGRITLPGRTALFLLRFFLDMALGEKQGTILLSSVKAGVLRENERVLVLRLSPKLNPERLKRLKWSLKRFHGQVNPLGDPLGVRVYYGRLLETSKIYENTRTVSLGRFIQPVFALALERSEKNEPAAENHAAIMALAMFAGSCRFEDLIGQVRTDPMITEKPYTKNIVLEGRRDLRLHFIISAGLKLVSDSSISFTAGEFKELLDAGSGGSGFSFADLAADRAGVRFAEIATGSERGARSLQSALSGTSNEGAFFPCVADFPENIPQIDFERVYGGVDNPAYRLIVDRIDLRIDQVYSGLEAEDNG